MSYPWFTYVESSSELFQGDFITECPLIVPPEKIEQGKVPEVEVMLQDCIILSQSCDLENGNIDNVLVCPYASLRAFLEGYIPEDQRNSKSKKSVVDKLKQGNLPGYHLLNKDGDLLDDYQVVDFRNVYAININALKAIAPKIKRRLRLLPPYREHLSQAFARFFMRVGLPQNFDIDGY